MTLIRDAILSLDRQWRSRNFAQDAVDADAYAIVLLVRFEMDVRCAIVDRVKQHLLNEPDHRRIIDFPCDAAFHLCDESSSRKSRLMSSVARLLSVSSADSGVFGDPGDQLRVVRRPRGPDTQTGLKTDFVQRPQIGGVGDSHGEPVSAC